MKKRMVSLIIIIIVLFVGIFISHDESPVIEESDAKNPLLIGSGETCPVYEPKGNLIYKSTWTGERPSIDKVTKDYRTATFGLG